MGRSVAAGSVGRFVGVFVEKFAEPIAERVEYTLHFAIATVIRLGRYASEKIVDIVQIQINP